MTPQTMAMMYAMNVGIGALRGKRGSNLWKDAFRDTTIMALTQGALGPKEAVGADKAVMGFDQGVAHLPQAGTETITDIEKFKKGLPVLEASQKTFSATPTPREGWRGYWDKAAGIFKSEQPVTGQGGAQMQTVKDAAGNMRQVPITMAQTDPLKVGLGSIGLGGGLYAAGMFDPVDPPEPKYPGYNLFYAQNPSQFMPYDDPDIAPIDYSQYPDKPYSGIQQGGIVGLKEGGQSKSKTFPLPGSQSWQQLYNMYIAQGLNPAEASASATATADQMPDIQGFFKNKQEGGIASFQRGGRAANQPNQNIIEATSEEEVERLRRLEIPHRYSPSPQDIIPSRPPVERPRIPFEDQPIEERGYGPGRSIPLYPTPQIDPRWFHPDNPRFNEMDVRGVKAGSLIDRLPSKTKVDENNPTNYKRTSGKLVVDSAGKGSENKDTMLAQLADGEFVTKSKAVRGAGLALGADPKNKKQQKDLGARYFYKQMAEFNKLAKSMAS